VYVVPVCAFIAVVIIGAVRVLFVRVVVRESKYVLRLAFRFAYVSFRRTLDIPIANKSVSAGVG